MAASTRSVVSPTARSTSSDLVRTRVRPKPATAADTWEVRVCRDPRVCRTSLVVSVSLDTVPNSRHGQRTEDQHEP
jgi:hypothetical protein